MIKELLKNIISIPALLILMSVMLFLANEILTIEPSLLALVIFLITLAMMPALLLWTVINIVDSVGMAWYLFRNKINFYLELEKFLEGTINYLVFQKRIVQYCIMKIKFKNLKHNKND